MLCLAFSLPDATASLKRISNERQIWFEFDQIRSECAKSKLVAYQNICGDYDEASFNESNKNKKKVENQKNH